jgi:serine/threonine-protein kinase RsbW
MPPYSLNGKLDFVILKLCMNIELEKITHTIASSPSNFSELEIILQKLRNSWDLPDDINANVELVLGEAINNAIIHGNKGNAQKNVFVSIEMPNHELCITVADEGPGFNFNTVPDPTLPENIEKPTGRGVFLMKQLADFVVFSNNGSVVELRFKL